MSTGYGKYFSICVQGEIIKAIQKVLLFHVHVYSSDSSAFAIGKQCKWQAICNETVKSRPSGAEILLFLACWSAAPNPALRDTLSRSGVAPGGLVLTLDCTGINVCGFQILCCQISLIDGQYLLLRL